MRLEIRPKFDDAVMCAELPVRKAAAKLVHVVRSLSLSELWAHPGFHFEKLHGMIEPVTGHQLYSLRVTQRVRAIASLLSGPTLMLISLHTQHDKAYL